MSRLLLLLALIALTGLGACDDAPSEGRPAEANRRIDRFLAHATEAVILPGFAAFASEAGTLAETAEALCAPAGATLGDLDRARQVWIDTATAWSRVIPFNLGPLDDDLITPSVIFIEPMRQRGIDYSQTVRETLAAAQAAEHPLDDAWFAGLTFNRGGLLALELLLFEAPDGDPALEAIQAGLSEPRRCALLRGFSRGLAARADALDAGWRLTWRGGPPFAQRLRALRLDDGAPPIAALLITLSEHLDYVKRRKLDGILDAVASGRFYPHQRATLETYAALLEAPEGLLAQLEALGAGQDATRIRARLRAAEAAAAAEDRAALAAALGALDGHFKRELPAGLGVELGLNFTDGD